MSEPRTIPLTQGYVAVVDAEDYEALSQFRWHATPGWNGIVYAARRKPRRSEPSSTALYMHRIILGTAPGVFVDHADGDGLNNTRSNIRPATNSQNAANTRKAAGCSSRFKGVYWEKARNKWCARIKVNQKSRYLGLYSDENAAGAAYDRAALEHFGAFARTNGVLA